MSKPVRETAGLCFIYNVDYINYMEEHALGVTENLGRKVGHLFGGRSHYVLVYQKDDSAEYDLSGSIDMKDLANILKNLIESGVCGHERSFTLQFARCIKPLASGEKNSAPVTGKILVRTTLRSRSVIV